MSKEPFEDLVQRMPKIAEVVNTFGSEAVQLEVYRTLIDSLLEGGADSGEPKARVRRKLPKKKRTKDRSNSQDEANELGGPSAVDSNDIVNTLKERADFGKLTSEVIHKKDLWNKIRLIMYLADTSMTSGEIFAVLGGLDVKTSLPSVSVKLRAQHASLIASGARKKGAINRYKLSGPARGETGKWLNEILK